MEKLEFPLKPSFILTTILGVLYIISLGILWATPINFYMKILLTPILIWQCWHVVIVYALKKDAYSVIKIWVDSNGKWGCELRKGLHFKGTLNQTSVRSKICIILYIHSKTRSITVPIFRDSLSAFQFKLLIARLKIM